jgi:putative redox protein
MVTTTAVIRQVQGITLAGRTDSNHWIVMDGPEEFGGSSAGIRPKELVLLALGGCTGSDVISILRKKRVSVDEFEMRLTAEQAEEHPQVFTKIHVEFVFRGEQIESEDVARAIELSETKYCAVSAMLRNSVAITHSYRIEPVGVPACAPAPIGAP